MLRRHAITISMHGKLMRIDCIYKIWVVGIIERKGVEGLCSMRRGEGRSGDQYWSGLRVVGRMSRNGIVGVARRTARAAFIARIVLMDFCLCICGTISIKSRVLASYNKSH